VIHVNVAKVRINATEKKEGKTAYTKCSNIIRFSRTKIYSHDLQSGVRLLIVDNVEFSTAKSSHIFPFAIKILNFLYSLQILPIRLLFLL